MKIQINLETGNDSFQNEHDIVHVLKKVANDIQDGLLPSVIRDINGNKVGSIQYDDKIENVQLE